MSSSPQHGIFSPKVNSRDDGVLATRLSPMEGATVDNLEVIGYEIAPSTHLPDDSLPGGKASAAATRNVPNSLAKDKLDEVDEEEERKSRRNRRIADLQQQGYNSPESAVNRRREPRPGSSGFSNAQIADHYSSCIRMCTENKVNVKNAFSLHLIDYMRDVMLVETDGELNFQMAGASLDASAKIYAYRVDVVHQDVYRMAGGLGRTDKEKRKSAHAENRGVGEFDDEADRAGADDVSPSQKRKKKKVWRGKTIETNLKNISAVSMDVVYETDSLFHKICSAFDGGGSSGLLLNSVRSSSDDGNFLLHSYWPRPKPKSSRGHLGVFENIEEISDILRGVRSHDIQSVCPSIQEFQFCAVDERGSGSDDEMVCSEFKFSGAANHIEEEVEDDNADAYPLQFPDDNDVDVSDNVAVGQEVAAEHGELGVDSAATTAQPVCRVNTLSNITRFLSSKPLEYSYFGPSAVQTWAGPDHWKVRHVRQGNNVKVDSGGAKSGVAGKKRREDFAVSFRGQTGTGNNAKFDVGLSHCLTKIVGEVTSSEDAILSPKISRVSTIISRSTLEKWSQQETTLDPRLDYAPLNFYSLLLKPKVQAKTTASVPGSGVEEPIDTAGGDYNFDCAADSSHFVANQVGVEDDEEEIPFEAADWGAPASPNVREPAEEEMEMVAAPIFKPPDLTSLKFARVAKRVDVRKLKSLMWSVLTETTPVPATPVKDTAEAEDTVVMKECSFSDLYRKVQAVSPREMATNLTPHIVFVCFLHMCNEKTLKLIGEPNHTDFRITQG